jgi:putative transposase
MLVLDSGEQECIARSIQLIAGSTAQAFNARRGRSGAFWEDRYHATAVESGRHLRRCLGYIALNMVRAGAISNPAQWQFCGYADIQNQRTRNQIIDRDALSAILQTSSHEELRQRMREIVEESRVEGGILRQSQWTESVAVGDRQFVELVKEKLGVRGKYRETVEESGAAFVLQEESVPYGTNMGNELSMPDNTRAWVVFPDLPYEARQ